jgi:hypothetical protein
MNMEYCPRCERYIEKRSIRALISEWYNKSSLKVYQKKMESRPGDSIGLAYMGFIAGVQVLILSYFPILMFWSIIAMFDRTGTTLRYLWVIVNMSMALCLPQFIFLWNNNYDEYLKVTGFEKPGNEVE